MNQCNSNFDFNKFNKPVIDINYSASNIYNVKNEVVNIKRKKAILFCGIAKPESFIYFVKKTGIKFDKVFINSDHYIYSDKDINNLKNYYQNDRIFLTTEKDYVKLINFMDFLNNFPVFYLKISIDIPIDSELLEKELNTLLN